MGSNEPITKWIEDLKDGDAEAAEKLWQRYYRQVVDIARRRLEGAKRAAADEEDVAVSTFKSLCLGAEAGRFPKLTDRDSLWALLMTIAVHKSTDLVRHENRKKRGGTGKANTEPLPVDPKDVVPLSQIIEQSASPEFAVQISSQFELLTEKLRRSKDPDLLRIAVAKMRGESNAEVAEQLGCVPKDRGTQDSVNSQDLGKGNRLLSGV